jgi:hypothetical protein
VKIITDNGEYTFHYEDDAIIYADPPRVQVTLINNETGIKVMMEVEFYELESMAEFLCEHIKCGICSKSLWHNDNRKWNHQVGYMCTPCTETSDHPAAQQHRAFSQMVMLDEEDRYAIRYSNMGVAVALRGMRYRIEAEGFTELNTWLLGQFLKAYLRKVGKLEGLPMNKCKVVIEVEREAIEGFEQEAQFAEQVKEYFLDILEQGNVSVKVKVVETLSNPVALSMCRLGFARKP